MKVTPLENIMKVTPLENKVLIKTVEPDAPKGLIEIPEIAKDASQEAIVLAIGTRRSKDGTKIDSEVRIGQHVIAHRYTGSEVKVGKGDYRVVGYDEIVCVLG